MSSRSLVSDEYPRPQLQRPSWLSLNGEWQFAFVHDRSETGPDQVNWTHRIEVPFAPESTASGIGHAGFLPTCWYRRLVPTPARRPGDRVLLHFGAVDYEAFVWVNGRLAGSHEGGYTPFTLDITAWLIDAADQEVIVQAQDDPLDLAKPRGKQDWQVSPHSIWYIRTTGIWQTVWIEVVPSVRIAALRWTSSLKRWEIGIDATITGEAIEGLQLFVHLQCRGNVLAEDTYAVLAHDVHRRIALADPGIDDYRNALLWSPEAPTLIEATLELRDAAGHCLDRVSSYTALREVGVDGDRFLLNGRPYFLRLVLDQGYWPESGLTPPNDEALRHDVRLAKAMGFNGVRKHQKIEDPRYLYWADRLGLLVWEEMPSAYRFTTRAIERSAREWTDVIRRDRSHPCIVTWVPFNESWGVPNLPSNRAEQHFVHAMYHLTKTLDPSRPVVGNDGWESVATDIIGIHDYDADVDRLRRRYHADEARPRLLRHERPAGRVLSLDRPSHSDLPIVLSEFGGLSIVDAASATWGYSTCQSTDALAAAFGALLRVVRSAEMFAGFCYTQFADTYQEANGLLYSDRRAKVPLEAIAAAICGSTSPAQAYEAIVNGIS